MVFQLNKLFILIILLIPINGIAFKFNSGTGSGIKFKGGQSLSSSSCTDGVDCVCDTVGGTLPSGTNVLFCEDFDDPVLYSANANGNPANLANGHWVDSTSCGTGGGERGFCQYWHQTYSTGEISALWVDGEPNASPRIGPTCVIASGSACNGAKEYCSTNQGNEVDGQGADCWEANSYAGTAIDIVKVPADFSDEITSNNAPKHPVTGFRGVIAGNHALAHRNGAMISSGIFGSKSWTRTSDVSVAMLIAFPTNLVSSGLTKWEWKFNEWGPNKSGLFMFASKFLDTTNGTLPENFPFQQWVLATSKADCDADTLTPGLETGQLRVQTECDNAPKSRFYADPTVYSRSIDWPDVNEWRCVRIRYKNLGTDNVCVTEWVSDGSTEKVVIDFCGMDGTIRPDMWLDKIIFNHYANAGQLDPPTNTETTYRYEDSIVVTDGEPPSCAAIGF